MIFNKVRIFIFLFFCIGINEKEIVIAIYLGKIQNELSHETFLTFSPMGREKWESKRESPLKMS